VNCKACNTRLPTGASVCPHCGHGERKGGFIDRPAGRDLNAESGTAEQRPLSPSSNVPRKPVVDEMELSLDEAVAPRRMRPTSGAGSQAGNDRSEARSAARLARKQSRVGAGDSRPAPMSLDAEHIRTLVCERPEQLEPGLMTLADGRGRPVGVGYETDVGEIDLLARDERGGYVVVEVSGRDAGPEAVSEMLHRIGWVRKHLREGNEKVRGILLLESMDDELGYAAAAVADTIDFRTWRLEVTFEALEV
jgi:hypothetical protein